jgi:hypothetical protein
MSENDLHRVIAPARATLEQKSPAIRFDHKFRGSPRTLELALGARDPPEVVMTENRLQLITLEISSKLAGHVIRPHQDANAVNQKWGNNEQAD